MTLGWEALFALNAANLTFPQGKQANKTILKQMEATQKRPRLLVGAEHLGAEAPVVAHQDHQALQVPDTDGDLGAVSWVLKMWLWVKTNGIPFWGRCTYHFSLF